MHALDQGDWTTEPGGSSIHTLSYFPNDPLESVAATLYGRTYVRGDGMSAIRSALEEWVNEDFEHLHLDQLADDLVELEHVSGLLEVERLRRISTFEERSGPHHFGYPSLTAFLKHRCRMASGRAHRLVARSRVFRSARATFQAWTAGRLSTDQAGVLLDQATSLPEPFVEGEDRLVDIVEHLGVTDTRRALEYWRQSVDGPGAASDELAQQDLRGVSLSESLGGMGHIEGWTTPSALQAFRAALEALMPPPLPGDTRTLAATARRARRPGPLLPRSRRLANRGRREATHQRRLRSARPPRHCRWPPRDRRRPSPHHPGASHPRLRLLVKPYRARA